MEVTLQRGWEWAHSLWGVEQHLPCPLVCVLLSSKPPLLWGFLPHLHKGWILEQVLRREGGSVTAL